MEWYWITLISAAGVYIVVSILLFIFPVCKKKNPIRIPHPHSPIILGAHRGGSHERMDNTIAAYQHAKDMGFHIMEIDVHFTRDKQVVVHHDKSLLRLTGLDRLVGEVDYADLPRCKDEVAFPYGDGIYKLKPEIEDGKIPLLKDVFEKFPGMPFNIDLKGGDSELLFEVYKLIKEYQREDITYYGDMNEKRNKKAKEVGEDVGIRTFASIGYTFWTVIFYFLGILQFIPFRHHSVWYPYLGPQELAWIREQRGNGCMIRFFTCFYGCITFCLKPMFWHLRRKGVLIIFWVVNSEEALRRAIKYPIDGVLTDKPQEIRRVIDNIMGVEDTNEPLRSGS